MLSPDEAREIAGRWRSKFVDDEAFERSWTRFFEMVGDPSPIKLQNWLAKDLAKDQVMHAGIVREPPVPLRSGYQTSDCSHCGGRRYVRADVPISDPRFGKASPCPDCNGGRRSDVLSAEPVDLSRRSGNRCRHCHMAENEPAGAGCHWPTWHSTLPQHATVETVLKRMA